MSSRFALLRSSHSHTRITFHPKSSNACIDSRSRSMLRSIFSFQNSKFDFGNRKYLQSSCPCQKHPLTKMTVLYFGKAISGVPGNFLTCTRKRSPRENRYFRTIISGFVSFPLTAAIQRLRCSGVLISVTFIFLF